MWWTAQTTVKQWGEIWTKVVLTVYSLLIHYYHQESSKHSAHIPQKHPVHQTVPAMVRCSHEGFSREPPISLSFCHSRLWAKGRSRSGSGRNTPNLHEILKHIWPNQDLIRSPLNLRSIQKLGQQSLPCQNCSCNSNNNESTHLTNRNRLSGS